MGINQIISEFFAGKATPTPVEARKFRELYDDEKDELVRAVLANKRGKIIFRTEDQASAERLAGQIISRDRALYLSKAEIDAMEDVELSDETIVLTKIIQTLPDGIGYLIPTGDCPVIKVSVLTDGHVQVIG